MLVYWRHTHAAPLGGFIYKKRSPAFGTACFKVIILAAMLVWADQAKVELNRRWRLSQGEWPTGTWVIKMQEQLRIAQAEQRDMLVSTHKNDLPVIIPQLYAQTHNLPLSQTTRGQWRLSHYWGLITRTQTCSVPQREGGKNIIIIACLCI